MLNFAKVFLEVKRRVFHILIVELIAKNSTRTRRNITFFVKQAGYKNGENRYYLASVTPKSLN